MKFRGTILILILTCVFVGQALAQQSVKIVRGKRFEVIDSLALRRADSLAVADSLFKVDSIAKADSLAKATLLSDPNGKIKKKRSPELEALNAELARREKFKLTRDTVSPGALVAMSLVPGLGQAYNKQYWKIPTFIIAGGGFLAGGLITDGQYRKHKQAWQEAVNLAMPREIRDPLEKKMQNAGTARTVFYGLAAATYLYQMVDATYNYRGYHNPVRTATLMAALFPGAGFIYTKTYWRLPIYYGGFALLATVVDYNSRNYQRYNNAYLAVADGDPTTVDEFNGRYSADVLRNAKDGYRRDRDFGIICLVGAYALSIIDTYVIASLKNWDVSSDLSVRLAPTMFEEQEYRGFNPKPLSIGMSLKIQF